MSKTFIAFAIVFTILYAWFYFTAPCNWLGWLPVKDVPARCVTFMVP
jgi:hypothetical protein